ncbi:unnamed protein product [Paramecium octaurelia]|uniref:Uncharacterized protein n=1 Tax=Paramecium octaurelia TaxID=43137 RepID=A0A8S1SMV2_PAROT|nr:unnamed protein product [Paramecium octaurelia]
MHKVINKLIDKAKIENSVQGDYQKKIKLRFQEKKESQYLLGFKYLTMRINISDFMLYGLEILRQYININLKLLASIVMKNQCWSKQQLPGFLINFKLDANIKDDQNNRNSISGFICVLLDCSLKLKEKQKQMNCVWMK